MKKAKLFATIGGCVAGAAILAAGTVLFLLCSEVDAAREKADQTLKGIERFYKTSDPFPSTENIAVLTARQKELEKKIATLRELLSEGAFEGREMTPQNFGRLRESTIAKLVEDAPKHDDGTSIVPTDCAFGFGRYDSGVPAAKADVPRLVRQLELVDRFVRILYAADVNRLVAVGREEFETDGGKSASSGDGETRIGRRTGRRGAKGVGVQTTGSSIAVPSTAAVKGEAGVGVRLERVGLVFDAHEKDLVAVLRAVDAFKPFAMISSFSMEKQGEDVVYPEEKAEEESGRSRRAAEKEAAATAPGIREKPAPRTARLVSGPLREAVVRVTLFVDVWAFPEEAASREEEEE